MIGRYTDKPCPLAYTSKHVWHLLQLRRKEKYHLALLSARLIAKVSICIAYGGSVCVLAFSAMSEVIATV